MFIVISVSLKCKFYTFISIEHKTVLTAFFLAETGCRPNANLFCNQNIVNLYY